MHLISINIYVHEDIPEYTYPRPCKVSNANLVYTLHDLQCVSTSGSIKAEERKVGQHALQPEERMKTIV